MSNPCAGSFSRLVTQLKRDRANLIHLFKQAVEARETLKVAPTEMVEDAASLEFWAAFDKMGPLIAEIEGRAS